MLFRSATVPFGLDEKLGKLGISVDDLKEFQPALIKLVVVVVALYLGEAVPRYFIEKKMQELEAELQKLTSKAAELQKDLASKKDIRKQMEQLNKEEVEANRQLQAVNALKQSRTYAFKALDELMVLMGKTDKVWIEDLKYEKMKMSLTGRCWEYFPINDFVKSIMESTRYSNVLFKDIQAEPAKNKMQGVPEALQKTKRFNLEYAIKEGD